jgi:FtsH-binding integral membrane protein
MNNVDFDSDKNSETSTRMCTRSENEVRELSLSLHEETATASQQHLHASSVQTTSPKFAVLDGSSFQTPPPKIVLQQISAQTSNVGVASTQLQKLPSAVVTFHHDTQTKMSSIATNATTTATATPQLRSVLTGQINAGVAQLPQVQRNKTLRRSQQYELSFSDERGGETRQVVAASQADAGIDHSEEDNENVQPAPSAHRHQQSRKQRTRRHAPLPPPPTRHRRRDEDEDDDSLTSSDDSESEREREEARRERKRRARAAAIEATPLRAVLHLIYSLLAIWVAIFGFLLWGINLATSTSMGVMLAVNFAGLVLLTVFTLKFVKPAVHKYEKCQMYVKRKLNVSTRVQIKYQHAAGECILDLVLFFAAMAGNFLLTLFVSLTALTVGDIGSLFAQIGPEKQAEFILLAISCGGVAVTTLYALFRSCAWMRTSNEALIVKIDPDFGIDELAVHQQQQQQLQEQRIEIKESVNQTIVPTAAVTNVAAIAPTPIAPITVSTSPPAAAVVAV